MAKGSIRSVALHGRSDPAGHTRGYVMKRHTHRWTYNFMFQAQDRRPIIGRECKRCGALQVNRLKKGWDMPTPRGRLREEIKEES